VQCVKREPLLSVERAEEDNFERIFLQSFFAAVDGEIKVVPPLNDLNVI
jgi:hypothetical protein